MEYLNRDRLEQISDTAFQSQSPYPWVSIDEILHPDAHEALRLTLPDVELFDRKVGVKRAFGQGYHDRYILHYHPSLELAEPWHEFISELHGPTYDRLVRRLFALRKGSPYILTLEWYYAWEGCGVSPHCDARRKLGTHIFYFNTNEDWQSDWGGHILIMDDKGRLKTHSAPEFDDLDVAASLDPRGNGSLLFQRTAHSWHGVRPLESPPGHLRKLFIITINVPTIQVLWRRVRGKDPDGYPLDRKDFPRSIPA
jgi:2OG-Fe(II) oxygenase superfamily